MFKQGFAKAGFNETYQKLPWKSRSDSRTEPNWPYLTLLLSEGKLSYLDYTLVHRLLLDALDASEEAALFLCHVVLAAKEGHLCVTVSNKELIPSVVQLWQDEEGNSLSADEMHSLTRLILSGVEQVPDSILTRIEQTETTKPNTPICRQGANIYLQKNWMYETLLLKALKKHLQITPAITINEESLRQSVDVLVNERLLLKEQAEAVVQGCLHPLTLVTGGPGTGKTYTAGHLIRTFWNNLSKEQQQSCQIVLAAPTGKAAANLQKSLGRVAASLSGIPDIQAKTIHALLSIRQGEESYEPRRLPADLLIVDESSMVDIRMMALLLDSLKPGSRLVLLGDRHQLPSVEAGSIFIDLIELHRTLLRLQIPCANLSVCMRAELESLIHFAQMVNKGQPDLVLKCLSETQTEGVKRLYFSNEAQEAQQQFLKHALHYFPTVVKSTEDPEQLLNIFQSIRLLSPMRKGPWGVETINQLIWQKLSSQAAQQGTIAIPIMIAVNDYRQELFNGETGVLIRRLPLHGMSENDYALFPPRKENEPIRRLSALLLPRYELAYCLSVHKSQGSEFDRIILVLPEGSEQFGREVFYTAITRARKQIEVFGSDDVIVKTVAQEGRRLSNIVQRMLDS